MSSLPPLNSRNFLSALSIVIFMSTTVTQTMAQADSATNGLITVKSNYSVTDTADRFEASIKDKGLSFFTRIDHSANAENAELDLGPTQVILFGNPKAGTPLMKCAPTAAVDLPQKALFWADSNDDVWLSYNDPAYLKTRHNIEGCDPVLEKITGLLNKLATEATQ